MLAFAIMFFNNNVKDPRCFIIYHDSSIKINL